MKTNIVLIGYMGTGKTAVGKLLAEKLGMKLIELDSLIEQQSGRKISEIFRTDGETAFRELEIEAAKKISGEKNSVIAGGGGIVLNKINIDRLRKNGVMVYLTASPQTILKRVATEKGQRPLLAVDDQLETITDMLKFRKPFYERSADITINTSRKNIETVVQEIIEKLKEYEGLSFKK
ncbi:MAG TPA: shikimate kinase [Dehalococcoidales bacterium]|nr:shikimate kinase [Dehalococcoidales bacterium]